MTEHSDPMGIAAADQYQIARGRLWLLVELVPERFDLELTRRVCQRLTWAISAELEPYRPLTWDQLRRSRPQR